MTNLPARQRGVALLVALLIVALAVILVAALLDRGELDLARTRNTLRAEQAQAYAQGLEVFAAQALLLPPAGADSHASAWATPLPPQPVPGGVISASLSDLNGCFNLNNLSPRAANQAPSMVVFKALLTNLGIADPDLADAVSGWLGASNAADLVNRYLAQPVPYRPHGDFFTHVSELRLVQGVTGAVYARLAPQVCVLPMDTKINVNTASAVLLQSLATGISPSVAQALWNNGQANFGDVATSFAGAPQLLGIQLPQTLLDVRSTYFLARGDIVLDSVPFTFYSLIEHVQGRPISVLARSRGSDDALVAPAPIATDPAAASARD